MYRLQRLYRLYRQSPATKNMSQFFCEIKSHKFFVRYFPFVTFSVDQCNRNIVLTVKTLETVETVENVKTVGETVETV